MTVWSRIITALVLGFVMALPVVLSGCGMTAPRSNPGFAELNSPGIFDTDNSMTLTIGPALLHFAAAHLDDDPEAQSLLRDLDGVRIRIYEIKHNTDKVAIRIASMRSKLQKSGWEPVMLVREEDEETHLLVKTKNDRIVGLTLLTMEDDFEVVFVNLMGEIRPQSFSNVMAALDVGNESARNVQVANIN